MLTVEALSFRYHRLTAFSELSFELAGGEIGVLVGANGSGKSTLLSCLAGWARPQSGHIKRLILNA